MSEAPRIRIAGTLLRIVFGAITLVSPPMADVAAAQDRPRPAVEFSAGWVGFADDGIVSESLVGGAVRWYLLPRIGVGPEVVYIGGDNHSHIMATGNLIWDLFGTTNGRAPQVTPFLVAGVGVFRTRESFFTGTFASSEGAFTGGGGIRTLVGNRVFVGIETRVGWELHLRLNGLIGLRLGG